MSIKELPWTLTNNTITVILSNGEPRTLFKSDSEERFNNVLLAIKDGEWDDVAALMDTEKHLQKFSEGFIKYEGGKLFIDNVEVPTSISTKILEYSDANLPYMPLVNFWRNLQSNTSYRAVQGLFSFLERNNFPLTQDGCFIAYKGVRSDWMDCYTGTIDNSVGKVVTMQRNQVNEDPEVTCSRGLHVANWDYAHQLYGGSTGGHTIMVKVNPADVVAVPVDYNYAKIRVCKYVVLQEVFMETKKLYVNTDEDLCDNKDLDEPSCENCFEACSDCACWNCECSACLDYRCY